MSFSPHSAQHNCCCKEKLNGKDSARQESDTTAGITGKAHSMVQLMCHELQSSPLQVFSEGGKFPQSRGELSTTLPAMSTAMLHPGIAGLWGPHAHGD